MSRDPASGDATRERILIAAASLFAERGFDGVTVGEIAEIADVSTANVHYHFTDKQTVYDRVVENGRELFATAFQPIESGDGTPRERIEATIHRYTHLVFEHPDAMGLLVEHIRRASRATDILLAGAGLAIQGLAAVIEEGVESGEFSPVDPHLAAEMLLGMMNVRAAAIALDSPGGVDETDPDAVAGFITALFFEGVCAC